MSDDAPPPQCRHCEGKGWIDTMWLDAGKPTFDRLTCRCPMGRMLAAADSFHAPACDVCDGVGWYRKNIPEPDGPVHAFCLCVAGAALRRARG